MLRGVLLVAILAQVAHAQPGLAPAQIQPTPPRPTVMDRRWSVHLGVGSIGLQPKDDKDAKQSFGTLELGAAFRIRPAIELAASLFAGGGKDDLSTGGLFIDVRYRFMAERPWNVLALGGIGIVSASRKDATDDEKRGRGALRLGVGVEHRWQRFAIDLQLRLIKVAKNDRTLPAIASPLSAQALSGGSLTLGGAFYF